MRDRAGAASRHLDASPFTGPARRSSAIVARMVHPRFAASVRCGAGLLPSGGAARLNVALHEGSSDEGFGDDV
jgi:hypothetical protein